MFFGSLVINAQAKRINVFYSSLHLELKFSLFRIESVSFYDKNPILLYSVLHPGLAYFIY